jgi:hypothetical protein
VGAKRVRRRRFFIVLILSLWFLAGSLAPMCGGHCTGMGMACCTSLCASMPGVLSTLTSLTRLPQHTVAMPQYSHPLTPLVKVPTPPPKDASFFA